MALLSRAALSRRATIATALLTSLVLALLTTMAPSANALFVQQGPRLTAAGASATAEFGSTVAIAADGNTALIGGPQEGASGAAWIFTRSGGVWTQGEKLSPIGASASARFGSSVAISADGNTALVGGFADSGNTGAAWVFTRSGSSWAQQGEKLVGSGASGPADQGFSVALSGDGNTALVGGPFDSGEAGAAWAFTRSGSSWTQQGEKLVGSGAVGAPQRGYSLALSGDGNTALIGGPSDNAIKGAAWVFTRSGSAWAQQGEKLVGSGAVGNAAQGHGVALSGDGDTALLGGVGDDGLVGATWAFTRSGSSWTQQGEKLVGSGASTESRQGFAVALSGDASTALIGAPFDSSFAGAAWAFGRTGATWAQLGTKLVGGSEQTLHTDGDFGIGVALSADGATALIGGEDENKASVFVDPPAAATTSAASGVGITTATLSGTAGAGPSSIAYFQYGTTSAYGASTPARSVGASASSTSLATPISGLTPGTTYHYRTVAENSGGMSVGGDQTFTTSRQIPPPRGHCRCPAMIRPRVTDVSESHSVWREGSRLASFSRRRPPVGTTFSFTLNEAARVTFAFTQRVNGRKLAHRCVAQTHANRRKRACKRTTTRATLSFTAHFGRNKVKFQGLISRSRKLKLGAYTLVITAANARGVSSAPQRLSFKIVK